MMFALLLAAVVVMVHRLWVTNQQKKGEVQAFEQEVWGLQDELGRARARYQDAEQVLGLYNMTPDGEKSALERVIDRVTADLIPSNKHPLDISEDEYTLDWYAREVLEAIGNK